jgi:hypothetical protein
MDKKEISPEISEKALTSIHPAYTLSYTQAQNQGEADQAMVDNFLGILAEVAWNVASRRKAHEQTGKQEPDH